MLSRDIKLHDISTHPPALRDVVAKDQVRLSTHRLSFTYDSYSVEDLLAKLLPANAIVAWDYETISHVTLLRLMEVHRPFLRTIGQVFYDKLGKETIAAVIGDAPPCVVAGVDNLEVMIKEGQCTFNFNLGHYLWSTRLLSERDRVLRKLSKTDVLLELGAGVGALGLQAAKFGCIVIASEPNDDNYSRLVKNAISNRLSSKVHAYKTAPVELLRSIVHHLDDPPVSVQFHESYYQLKSPPVTHLPTRYFSHLLTDLKDAETLDVLTALYGLYKGKRGELPTIHCYLNSTSEIPREDLLKRINQKWRFKLNEFDELKYVSMQKGIKRYYVSFKLPSDVAYADLQEEVQSDGEIEEPCKPVKPAMPSILDLQQSMAADIEFMQRSMKEGLQPSLLMSHLASFIGTGSLKRSADVLGAIGGGKKTKE